MRFLKYFFLFLFILIWIVALSPTLSSKVIVADSYRFGDLYRLSNLSKFRDPRTACIEYKVPVRQASNKKVNLYIIGDSFTEEQRVGKKDFAVDSYTYVHWSELLHLKLDTTQTNILLLETVERHFREKFAAPVGNLVADSSTFIAKSSPATFMTKLDGAFNSKSTELRLDEILFQNDFMIALKELKSDFNLNFFDRVNKEVVRVNDGDDVVWYMDTDTPNTTSSFAKLRNGELDSLVQNLNETQTQAIKMGFNKVIISIIPNKVSVLAPGYDQYNYLIKRVYSHPDLKVRYIDVYGEFQKLGKSAYLKGDSHWTCQAQYLWLDKVNNKIGIDSDSDATNQKRMMPISIK